MAIKITNPLKLIDIEKIYPNIDNPRQELGDLTELISSVKENGVMQNLTVFQKGDKFIILMGHRRYAAAKAAGIKRLYCTLIEEPSKEEQLHIMLMENIQRNDLTLMEEARAFHQLYFDFGEPIREIATKTGLGETTVRRRIKIGELDADAIKKAHEHWQVSLQDYAELEKIDDVKQRNKILTEVYNSNDLKWRVDRYVRDKEQKEKYQELMDIALKGCPELAKADTKKQYWELNGNKYELVVEYSLKSGNSFKMNVEKEKKYYLYIDVNFNRFRVYTEKEQENQSEDDLLEEKREEYIRKSQEELQEIFKEAIEKVYIAINATGIAKDLTEEDWMDMAMFATTRSSGGITVENIWKGLKKLQGESGLNWWSLDKKEKEAAIEEVIKMPLAKKIKMFLINWLSGLDTRLYGLTPPSVGTALVSIIDTLYLKTPFEVKDDIIDMLDGTHKLYKIPPELEYDDDDEDEEDDEEEEDDE